MPRTLVLCFIAALLALSSPAFARQLREADRGADTQRLSYFVGDWQVSARDPRTGETLQLVYSVEPMEGGVWLVGRGASRDGSFSARDMWGRDPRTGELMRVIFDGGGAFATVRARAWEGGALVLEGEAYSSGGIVRVRETITPAGPDLFEAIWAAHRDGEWVDYSVETVTRLR